MESLDLALLDMENLTDDFFDFIKDNRNKDTTSLRLSKKASKLDFNLDFALLQIDCRKKTKHKLKEIIEKEKFIFPDSVASEQASHQAVAFYHSSIFPNTDSVLDMTAGLGIDSLLLSMAGKNVTAVEINLTRADVLIYNSKLFPDIKINVVNEDALSFLNHTDKHYDLIFVDPARRSVSNSRVYNLHDCEPDILENLNLIQSKSAKILIKASPMLDITQTLRDFDDVSSIRAVGVKGECKEILIEISNKGPSKKPDVDYPVILEAVNLDDTGNVLSSFSVDVTPTKQDEDKNTIRYASNGDIIKGSYLLEPSAMVMKLTPWKEICDRFNAKKLDPVSHLFVSDKLPEDFPGRVTEIDRVIQKKDRKNLVEYPASVVARNYPLSSESLRKSLRLSEGDKNFIYATRIASKPVLILCRSIN